MTSRPKRAGAAADGRRGSICGLFLLLFSVVLASGLSMPAPPANALSELKREEVPPPAEQAVPDEQDEPSAVPMPDPLQSAPGAEGTQPDEAEPDEGEPGEAEPGETPGQGTVGRPAVDPDAPLPEILYDTEALPEPVKRMRQLIIEAAKTGDIEALRPLLGSGDSGTQLSLGGVEGDPVAFLRELSGDKDGQEILAILEEVLNAGYVHVDVGTPNELYVWPYFFAIPLDKLDPRQRVELFKIVTAGDYEDMKTYGAYIFYRVGITPDGHWSFFVAGD